MTTQTIEPTPPEGRIEVRNPADGTLIAQVEATPVSEVAAQVEAARTAQVAWAARSYADRAAALRALARRIRDDEKLKTALVGESGKPMYEAEMFEMLYLLDLVRFYTSKTCQKALDDELRDVALLPNKRARVTYRPHGVVGVIGPWNWPLLNNFADCVAPLLAGNAVILKPSEYTPLTSMRVRELWIEQGLPADVFQVAVGRGAVGAELVERADMIFFTGSDHTGRFVAARCGTRLIPCVLELGGKSSMIVLADADLPRAARAAVWSSFAHSGQVCIRTERIFVEAAVADQFTALCQTEAKRLRHGAGAEGVHDVGAMTFPPQVDHVESQVADAIAHGGRILTGGKRADRPGNYFEPTLIANANLDMRVMREETFGPIVPIMRVQNAEEAVRLTNDSPLGLSGSIWSTDEDHARELARRVEAGSVCINDVLLNYMCVEAPLGGVKDSGLGVRHGVEGLRQFCRLETIVEDRGRLGPVSSIVGKLMGFPYDKRLMEGARWYMKRRY